MNHPQTTFFFNNSPPNGVPQQPYAEPVAFDGALVNEFLTELGVALLEVNFHYSPFPGYLSTISSLSGALGNAGRSSDEWTGHVTVNPGNTFYDSTNTTYAPFALAFTSQFPLSFVPDHTSTGAFYLPRLVPGFLPPAVAQISSLMEPVVSWAPQDRLRGGAGSAWRGSEFYPPFPSHVSHQTFMATSGTPESLAVSVARY
ncbi:hypothetical protein BC834DRAFT_519412 [Gloeopeniophorella convolvens]|nr:hypothetical protein BC834DRAFT_519412 [Gloeopeniophorella convolvens]